MLPKTNAGPDDYHVGPHIMVAVPNGTGLSDYTANPRSGGAYINRVHGTDIPTHLFHFSDTVGAP